MKIAIFGVSTNIGIVLNTIFRKPPIARSLHTSDVFSKITPNDGSNQFMARHLNDPYVKMSRYKNYRARSAFKLLEIDDKHSLLKPGHCVIDCGAAPGSWTQVSVERVNATGKIPDKRKGFVLGVDLLPIIPINGAVLLSVCDFREEASRKKIQEHLDGKEVDLILSDMCPNITGLGMIDNQKVTELGFIVLNFAVHTLKPRGHLLIKSFDGFESELLYTSLQKFFHKVKRVKSGASRTESSEMYFLALNFKGVLQNK